MVTAPKNGDFLVHHCGASLETLGHIDMRVCVQQCFTAVGFVVRN